MEAVVVGGFLSRFSVGNANDGLLKLSHLLSANDTFIFYDADCG